MILRMIEPGPWQENLAASLVGVERMLHKAEEVDFLFHLWINVGLVDCWGPYPWFGRWVVVNVDIVALLLLRDPSTIDPGDKFAPNCIFVLRIRQGLHEDESSWEWKWGLITRMVWGGWGGGGGGGWGGCHLNPCNEKPACCEGGLAMTERGNGISTMCCDY